MHDSDLGAFSMRTHQIEELRSRLIEQAAGIQAALDELERQAESLRPHWSGAASAAYDSAHARWSESMARLGSLVHSAGNAAGSVLDRHHEARGRVTALWS
ncbi:WXG100 family type VII secretion target [Agromyces soli]